MTKVTNLAAARNERRPRATIAGLLSSLDPRRRLGSKVGWLVACLSLAFALVAALWLGSLARQGLVQQHCRQLAIDAGQVANALDQELGNRLQSVKTIAAILGTSGGFRAPNTIAAVLSDLGSTDPELGWVGFADRSGRVLATSHAGAKDFFVVDRPWFVRGLQGPWIGEESRPAAGGDGSPTGTQGPSLPAGIDLAVPVRDPGDRVVGVVDARLRVEWLRNFTVGLRRAIWQMSPPEAIILNRNGVVLAGPREFLGLHWSVAPMDSTGLLDPEAPGAGGDGRIPAVSLGRLGNGRKVICATVTPSGEGALHALAWTLLLVEPASRADQRAKGEWIRIIWVCMAMGGVAALGGVVMSRRLTRMLAQLSHSVDAVGSGATDRIEVPAGADEVARLGSAFASLLETLQREQVSLHALRADLERRVASRTREVERLARESRYAAVVRERLKIARDLHDTLAHSMMAMLAEVRLLRKLHARDPGSLAAELAHAEQVAHEGLIEARASITKMRFNPVRDVGLGTALADTMKHLAERTGLRVEMDFDPAAASFAEETAEGVFRIAEEALRNVERHAHAGSVKAALRHTGAGQYALIIEDDGLGFDAAASPAGHFGLLGMREQAQLIGAELTIQSGPGMGTRLFLRFGSSVDPEPIS